MADSTRAVNRQPGYARETRRAFWKQLFDTGSSPTNVYIQIAGRFRLKSTEKYKTTGNDGTIEHTERRNVIGGSTDGTDTNRSITQVHDRNKRTIERIYANARTNLYRQTTA